MKLTALRAALPAYARDVQRTLTACLDDDVLSADHRAACIVAAAQTLASPALLAAAEAEAPHAIAASARGAAAVMAMNNVYFRAVHATESSAYGRMRPGLRMQALHTGVDKVAIELVAIVVSALNGCGACLDEHEERLRACGGAPEQAHAALKLAAALAGFAHVLRAQDARAQSGLPVSE